MLGKYNRDDIKGNLAVIVGSEKGRLVLKPIQCCTGMNHLTVPAGNCLANVKFCIYF